MLLSKLSPPGVSNSLTGSVIACMEPHQLSLLHRRTPSSERIADGVPRKPEGRNRAAFIRCVNQASRP